MRIRASLVTWSNSWRRAIWEEVSTALRRKEILGRDKQLYFVFFRRKFSEKSENSPEIPKIPRKFRKFAEISENSPKILKIRRKFIKKKVFL